MNFEVLKDNNHDKMTLVLGLQLNHGRFNNFFFK